MSYSTKAYWRRVIDQNPARVVTHFRDVRERTPVGQSLEALAAVTLAVSDIAENVPGLPWPRLVQAGIIKELCECALHAPYSSHLRPGENDSPGTFFFFILPLVFGFSRAPDAYEPAILKDGYVSMKEFWTRLTIRLWEELLLKINMPLDNRMIFVNLILSFIGEDSDFSRIVNAPDDRTVSLMSYFLMRSPAPLDFRFCSLSLAKIVGLPNGRADERAPDMLERLVCGVPDRSFVLFMDRFATMVEVLPIDMLLESIALLWILCKRTRWGPLPDREFLDALVHSKTLFSALFSRFTYDEDTGSIQTGEEIDPLFMDSMQLTLVCMDRLRDRGATSRETKAFMETCCHAGLFEAFERVLVHHREMIKDAPGIISVLVKEFYYCIGEAPSALPSIRRRLPRPLLLRALLEVEFGQDLQFRQDYQDSHEPARATRAGWIFLDALHRRCHVNHRCMRRGCPNRRRARCKDCQMAEYCSVACQNQDWPEHRMICGFRDVPGGRPVGRDCASDLSPPERFPFRFGQAVWWY